MSLNQTHHKEEQNRNPQIREHQKGDSASHKGHDVVAQGIVLGKGGAYCCPASKAKTNINKFDKHDSVYSVWI